MTSISFFEKKNLFYTKIQKQLIKIYKIEISGIFTTNKIINFYKELNNYMQNFANITFDKLEQFLKLFIINYCTESDINVIIVNIFIIYSIILK
jgi:hypothetical protein